ncbi:hypothetical protein XA68_11930 [Ophiocordyceps unilateralis]|uniref:Uncharacterized protein n=1 Tax=Ophiocordyceps unilateralis TaxID=268505 RepID=A0A2A9PED2_OPHUN|nr:hypothetical protein XA68_11930 [Ophiocordyceps unilateralis]
MVDNGGSRDKHSSSPAPTTSCLTRRLLADASDHRHPLGIQVRARPPLSPLNHRLLPSCHPPPTPANTFVVLCRYIYCLTPAALIMRGHVATLSTQSQLYLPSTPVSPLRYTFQSDAISRACTESSSLNIPSAFFIFFIPGCRLLSPLVV